MNGNGYVFPEFWSLDRESSLATSLGRRNGVLESLGGILDLVCSAPEGVRRSRRACVEKKVSLE